MKKRALTTTAKRLYSGHPNQGYALGAALREKGHQRALRLGEVLNRCQHRAGTRTTGLLVVLLWLAAFCYFTYQLLTLKL